MHSILYAYIRQSFLSVTLFVVEGIISQSIKNKVATQATLYNIFDQTQKSMLLCLYIRSGMKVHAPLTGYLTQSYRRFDSL